MIQITPYVPIALRIASSVQTNAKRKRIEEGTGYNLRASHTLPLHDADIGIRREDDAPEYHGCFVTYPSS
mgnify:CR=1 FL=1